MIVKFWSLELTNALELPVFVLLMFRLNSNIDNLEVHSKILTDLSCVVHCRKCRAMQSSLKIYIYI